MTIVGVFASMLRGVADMIDPKPTPTPNAQRDLFLKPPKVEAPDDPVLLVPLPDVEWNRSGWGNYL